VPRRLAPNLEDCSLAELEIAAHAAPSRRSHNIDLIYNRYAEYPAFDIYNNRRIQIRPGE
jgi:hypothetical protein